MEDIKDIKLVRSTKRFGKIAWSLLAIVLVVGVASGAFFFTKSLNQAATLNAPTINPFAKSTGDGGSSKTKPTTVKTKPTTVKTPDGPANGNFVEGEKDSRYSQNYKDDDTVLSNGTVVNSQNNTINCDAGYYSCQQGTRCCKIGAVEEKKSGGNEESITTTASCTVTSWSPPESAVCSGTNVTQTSNCGTTRVVGGTKYCCTDTTWTPNPSLTCTGTNVTQTSNCGTTRVVGGTKYCCTDTTWTPNIATVCNGTALTQTSNCGNTRQAGGTKVCCTDATWTPNPSLTCTGTNVTQTSNCGTTRSVAGTKYCCTDTTWTPATNTVCTGTNVTQTSNCETEREVDGTKACSLDLSLTKKAYKDESSNSSGSYSLRNEIDTVSRNQVFVYAFEIENTGEAKAENITVVDTLKGDNQELLTFVDAESGCKYTSSNRKVTCTGMNLEADETDTYKFRVKVSSSATNGETIKNVGVMSYKDMPTGDDLEASLELAISTVVGCNNTCTSDDECSTGLSCDPSTDKCRKPTCSESSSCNCPRATVAPTSAPTSASRVVVPQTRTVYVTEQKVAQPNVLPESGILDFPGVAAFGGGLLLAIIGILLAL